MSNHNINQFSEGDWNIITTNDKGLVNLMLGLSENTARVSLKHILNSTDPWPYKIKESALISAMGKPPSGSSYNLDSKGNYSSGYGGFNSGNYSSNRINYTCWNSKDDSLKLVLWPKPNDYTERLNTQISYYKNKKDSGEFEVRGDKLIMGEYFWDLPKIDLMLPKPKEEVVVVQEEEKKKWKFW